MATMVGLNKSLLAHRTLKLCSKFGEARSINDVTSLSTDAGRRTSDTSSDFIFCPMLCIALDRQYKSWLPVIVIKHNSSWLTVDITVQHTMTWPIGGQFSHLAAMIGRVSVVQFLTSDVYRKAVVLSCTAPTSSGRLIIIIIIIVRQFVRRRNISQDKKKQGRLTNVQ